jgi:hypothetical protein
LLMVGCIVTALLVLVLVLLPLMVVEKRKRGSQQAGGGGDLAEGPFAQHLDALYFIVGDNVHVRRKRSAEALPNLAVNALEKRYSTSVSTVRTP